MYNLRREYFLNNKHRKIIYEINSIKLGIDIKKIKLNKKKIANITGGIYRIIILDFFIYLSNILFLLIFPNA